MNDLLKAMLARRAERERPLDDLPVVDVVAPDPEDPHPSIDAFTENIAYHWRRYEREPQRAKVKAVKPEAAVLAAIKRWMIKVSGIDCKRVSVGKMRTSHGFMMNLGGDLGESDLVLTPHKGQPFERQIHVEVKRPKVVIDGKTRQAAGIQSAAQKAYQQRVEARGDKYVVVTSVDELRSYLESIGFTDLPRTSGR